MKTFFDEYAEVAKAEFAATEPDMTFGLDATSEPAYVMDLEATARIINGVKACPNGVMRMSDSMPGLVETSVNLAVVTSDDNTVEVMCLMRSSVDSAKNSLGSMIESVFTLAGATVEFSGAYPGWKPNMDSAILKAMQDVYQKMYGNIPEIKAIHAGLECGLLGGVYPNWDMISCGPTIRFPHSPDEKVNIASVQKWWDFLLETLKNAPVK
jgi:dipeptidase D